MRSPCSGGDDRQRAHLAQPLLGTERQLEPRRVGAVGDVDVMVPRDQQRALRQPGMRGQGRKELRPFGGSPGVGHVAGDEDDVDRPLRMDGFELREHLLQPIVALRPGPAAFDAETVTLADNVEIGEMRHPPGPATRRRRIEAAQVMRLRHARVRHPPNQRRGGHICTEQDHRIGESGLEEMVRCRQVRHLADPARARPHQQHDHARDYAQDHRRTCGGRGPQPGAVAGGELRQQHTLEQVPKRLAAERVDRLDRDGVERPEAMLDGAEQRPPAEPAGHDHRHEQEQRQDVADPRGDLGRQGRKPAGDDERRDAQQQAGQHDEQTPRCDQLRQADLGQQAAGDGEQRALLGAGRVVLDVAEAWIDEWSHGSGRRTQIEGPVSSYTAVCHLRMSDDEYSPGRRPGAAGFDPDQCSGVNFRC